MEDRAMTQPIDFDTIAEIVEANSRNRDTGTLTRVPAHPEPPVLPAYIDGAHLRVWCEHERVWHVHGRCARGGLRHLRCGYIDFSGGPSRWQQDLCECPHGEGDGHRVAHCGCKHSPLREGGYILQEVGEFTDAVRGSHGRLNHTGRCPCERARRDRSRHTW